MERVLDFPLASIKSDEHLAQAQRVIDELLARGTLDDGEEMYLDALSDLAGSYEDEHHVIEPASDADMLRHLMDAKGVLQMQLSRDTGLSKSTISEVLAGKKPFSRKMIHTMAHSSMWISVFWQRIFEGAVNEPQYCVPVITQITVFDVALCP